MFTAQCTIAVFVFIGQSKIIVLLSQFVCFETPRYLNLLCAMYVISEDNNLKSPGFNPNLDIARINYMQGVPRNMKVNV